MSRWLALLDGKIDAAALEQARHAGEQGKDPADFLLERNIVPVQTILAVLSAHYRVPAVQIERYLPDEKIVEKISEEVARRFTAIPLFKLHDRLYTAMADPGDLDAVDYLRHFTGLTVEPVIAVRSAIENAINRFFITKDRTERTVDEIVARERALEEASTHNPDVRVEDKESPVIKLVDYILSQAVHMGASDVHMEAFAKRIELRYRVDGVLHPISPPPPQIYRSVVSRIKILSGMDIAEHRLPQDGRARIHVGERDYDLRVSIIPGLHGEGIVIRVLDTGGPGKILDDIGFSKNVLDAYRNLIHRPNGILLVTGPTGSGKTTTLYATLGEIFTPKKKFITLEDPVEYQMEGVEQIQINAEIGFTFAAGLRSVLRHDPDVVMLGEIRDLESAEIAIRSSLTGHFVLSTLHTNDAPSAATRLVDMGLEPYLVFSSLVGVLAQRLVRRLCPRCKIPADLEARDWAALGAPAARNGAKVFRPGGCEACGGLGYRGRVPIGEFLEITSAMRRLPPEKIVPGVLRELAREKGFTTLRENAVGAMLAGLTSMDEVLGVTVPEE